MPPAPGAFQRVSRRGIPSGQPPAVAGSGGGTEPRDRTGRVQQGYVPAPVRMADERVPLLQIRPLRTPRVRRLRDVLETCVGRAAKA